MAEHAVAGPRRGPGQRSAPDRSDLRRVGARQPEHLPGQAEPGGLPGTGGVIDAWRAARLDQRGDLERHIHRPGGLPVLVVNHADVRAAACLGDHRGDEVAPVRAVQPGGADDVAGQAGLPQDGPFPGQLGTAVGGARGWPPGLRVRLAGPARRTRSPWRPGRARLPRAAHSAASPDTASPLRRSAASSLASASSTAVQAAQLTTTSGRHGRAGATGTAPASVMSRSARDGPGHGLAPVFQDGHQIPAQHPPGPGHQPTGHRAGPPSPAFSGSPPGPAISPAPAGGRFSGSHQARCSAYQRTVAARPSANGIRGA